MLFELHTREYAAVLFIKAPMAIIDCGLVLVNQYQFVLLGDWDRLIVGR